MIEETDGQKKIRGYFGEVWRVLEQMMEFR
jgi:hypothetical protein